MNLEPDNPSFGSMVPYASVMTSESNLMDIPEDFIKNEITFEEEKITETTYLELPLEQIYHVEVGVAPESAEDVSANKIIGEMCELQRNDEKCPDLNESEVSDALNDHNYTTQEVLLSQPNLDSVRDILLSHIVSNGVALEGVPIHISSFIDETIEKIKILQLENRNQKADESLSSECLTQSNITNHTILPDNCSEPLEVEANDEYFENLYENSENKTLFAETKDFAKEFYNECNSITSKTEEDLKLIVLEKIERLKKIANVIPTTDQSVQTVRYNSIKKRRRINRNAKRNLLDSSASSEYDSEHSGSFCEQKNDSEGVRLKPNRDSLQSCNIDKDQAKENDYNDGIDLSKYIKLDITNRKFRKMSCEFDSDGKHESNSCFSDEDTDKEIDRLTNLNALKKRHGQNRLVKPKEKNKPKTLSMKSTNNLDELDEDLETYDTDNSFKESVDEEITERQYLSRFNERIKMELLNDSNSDSGLSDQSDYNLSKESSSSENDGKSDVVNKFLEVFKCEADDNVQEDKSIESKENKSEVEITPKESDSLDVSDELWNDNINKKKKSKKSFEKLLAEAEKRNQNEEIVLSSESEYSDAGPEPVEEKSRLIKPMLRSDQLANETRAAQKSETERIKRLEKKHQILSKAMKSNSPESGNKSNLILDYIEKTKTFIKVDVDIVKQLKPHQIDGLRFMYDSCYGGIDHTKKNTGSGCILAHCMGLGKTLQLIALLHTVISYKELNTTKVLVLCPKSTVMNWADELQRWLAPLKTKTNIKVFVFPDASDITDKLRVLEDWSKSSDNRPGCLLVGYEAFRTLVFYHSYKNRGNLSSSKLESIREKVNSYLLEPGADLVVCDEGHVIKNSKSAISLAVAKIITPKRIILTGTPIQNNLKEYYSMVNFIKPLYLGTEKEFANLYANPIKNGQHKDSSKKDITVMKQRSYVLHKKLSKFVQRKEAELLKTFLPQKFEYVLFIPMTAVQNTLYEYSLEAIASRGDSRGKSLITDYTVLRKIWTHPKVLEDAWKNANMQKNKKDHRKVGSDDDQPDDIYDSQTGLISVTNDWWRKYLSKKDLETVMPSNKLRTMFTILRMCEEKGEKCLIFSAFVAVLNVVEYFFKKITQADPEILQHIHIPNGMKVSNTWIKDQDYYRLDGKTPKNIRHEMIKRFNSEANRRARVFLISAKAGGQGINLTGANRVIILDTSWNPSNDQQNIFRIFRLGQKRNCYIYRLLAMGTMEEKVYSRSVTKQAMSFRVVDEQQIDRHYNMAELAELYTLTIPKQSERTMPLLPKDTILAHLLRQSELVYKYHEHDSLLENKVEQELSEQEKTDAWDTYEREQQMTLAQQEGFNAERNPNTGLPPKFPPFLGPVPNLDMQTLLNYSQLTASIMPPYNYGLNQSYLDSLNLYQKYSSMRYPELNSYVSDGSFSQSPFGVLNAANLNRSSIMPNLPGVPNTKPHSRDFGLYDAQKARSNLLPHQQLIPTMPQEPLAGPSVNTNPNNVLANLSQYKQLLENPLSSLLNYSAQSYPPPSTAENMHANLPTGLSTYTEKVIDAVESLNKKDKVAKPKPSPVDQNTVRKAITPPEIRTAPTVPSVATAPIVSSVDLTTTSTPVSVTSGSALVKNQLASKKHQIQSTTMVDLTTSPSSAASAAAALSIKNSLPLKKGQTFPNQQRQMNLTSPQGDDDKTNSNQKTANVNFPTGFSSGRGSTLSKDFLKSNAEMQIIPTTSPPGTSSITKQLTEMSPSISLTAVNPVPEKPKPRTQQSIQKSNNTILGTDNRQTVNAFKSKKSANQNFVALAKAVDNVLTSLTPTKTLSGKEKSMPISFAQPSLVTAKPSNSQKVLTSEALPPGYLANADPKLLTKRRNIESIPPNTKSINANPVRPAQVTNEGRFVAKDGKTLIDINQQGGTRNIPRKRSTESPKANLNVKRTKQ